MIDDGELIAGLERLLEEAEIAPDRLTLEIVPSGPGAGSELDSTVVKHLRALGVKLSLDDLGRASSVAAIRTLPLDQVKIDAMFLHEAGRGGPTDAIVRSLVGLAYGLGSRDGRGGRREQARLGGGALARLRLRAGLLPRAPDARRQARRTGSPRRGPSSPVAS